MSDELLKSLAWLAVLGIGSQWVAWRLRLPSILLLLVAGFVAGPILRIIEPNVMLGDLLMPVVSLSVSLILFEGGLTLRFSELKDIGHVVRNLVTVGALVTWVACTVAAQTLLGWSLGLAAVFGGIVVVTGPTVIGPLLRLVQPARQVASVLKWEGIVIDPVGAVMALLVFEMVHAGQDISSLSTVAGIGLGKTLAIGTGLGLLGGEFLVRCMKRHWVPDFLQNPVALMTTVGLFTLSNLFQHESGLLTVTVMGIFLANQKRVDIHHVLEFKENLRVLLISALFILLAARIELADLRRIPVLGAVGLLLAMIVLVRPASVFVSTAGSRLNWRERGFLAWMAPRGIVAAAVASIFAQRLEEAGVPRANELVPVTFFLIISTVAIYGLTAIPVARALGVSSPNPQGILFAGAHAFARAMAGLLRKENIPVLLVDVNRENLAAARMEGLPVHFGNILSDHTLHELDLAGIGRLLAVTPNHEVNSLAVVHFRETFGRAENYQLARESRSGSKKQEVATRLGGRVLFEPEATWTNLQTRLRDGAVVKKTTLTGEFTYEQFKARHGHEAVPLFLVNGKGQVRIFCADEKMNPPVGWSLISLVKPRPETKRDESAPATDGSTGALPEETPDAGIAKS